MSLPLALAVLALSPTSTASTYQRAAVGWEVAAEEAIGQRDTLRARLDVVETDLELHKKAIQLQIAANAATIADLKIERARLRREAANRVPKWRRNVAAASVAAIASGTVGLVLSATLCPDRQCRERIGLTSALIGVAGGVGVLISW